MLKEGGPDTCLLKGLKFSKNPCQRRIPQQKGFTDSSDRRWEAVRSSQPAHTCCSRMVAAMASYSSCRFRSLGSGPPSQHKPPPSPRQVRGTGACGFGQLSPAARIDPDPHKSGQIRTHPPAAPGFTRRMCLATITLSERKLGADELCPVEEKIRHQKRCRDLFARMFLFYVYEQRSWVFTCHSYLLMSRNVPEKGKLSKQTFAQQAWSRPVEKQRSFNCAHTPICVTKQKKHILRGKKS